MSDSDKKQGDEPKRLDADDLAKIFEVSPFIRTLGLEVVAMDYDAAELTVRHANGRRYPDHEPAG